MMLNKLNFQFLKKQIYFVRKQSQSAFAYNVLLPQKVAWMVI